MTDVFLRSVPKKTYINRGVVSGFGQSDLSLILRLFEKDNPWLFYICCTLVVHLGTCFTLAVHLLYTCCALCLCTHPVPLTVSVPVACVGPRGAGEVLRHGA